MFLSSLHCEKSVSGLIIETLFFFSRCELFLLLIEFLFPDSLNGKISFFFNAWLIMIIIFLDDSYLKSYFFLIKEDHLVIFNCCVFIQEKSLLISNH